MRCVAAVKAFPGNGRGVSIAAEPYYRQMLAPSTLDRLAGRFVPSLIPTSTASFGPPSARGNGGELLGLLEPKLTRPTDRTLYEAVRHFTGLPHQLHADTKIARLATPRRIVHRRTTQAGRGCLDPGTGR